MTLRELRGRIAGTLPLLANAGAMMGSTLATAGLGFVYWWVAARFLPMEAVGLASAAIAAMGFLALAGDLGLGTLLIGQIPRQGPQAGGLISASFLTAAAGSALLGWLYLWLIPHVSAVPAGSAPGVWHSLLFIGGVGLTGLTLVLDQTLLGVMQGRLHLIRNIVFALTKLLLLVAAIGLKARQADLVYASWAAGNAISLLLLAWLVLRSGVLPMRKPDFRLLRSMTGAVASHHALNVLSQAPGLLLPVLVTHLLSARINAAFYAAWMLIGVAWLAPASLTTALFTVAANHPAQWAPRLRFTLSTSVCLSGLTMLGCALGGGFALRLFNTAYADMAKSSLLLLACAMPAVSIKYHYIAIKRIREEMPAALPALAIGVLMELGGAAYGGVSGGLQGLCLGWLIAIYLEAIGMSVVVLREAEASLSRPRTDVFKRGNRV